MVVGADHSPLTANAEWPELTAPEPPVREDPWAESATAVILKLVSAANIESEEDPNTAIGAYLDAQGKALPEAPEEVEAAKTAMGAEKGFLEHAKAAMEEGKMTTLRPARPETSVKEGEAKTVEARFETADQVVVLVAPSAATAEGATWGIGFAGAASEAPAREKVPGYNERNIMEFWKKLDEPDSEVAFRLLCWIRSVDRVEVATSTQAEVCQDYHFCVMLFLKEQKFTAEQAMHVMLLADRLYNESVAQGSVNTKRGTFDLERSNKMLKLGLISLAAPPLPHKPMLTEGQATAVVNYFAKTFFMHYSMHVYLYIYRQDEDKIARELPVETPMEPLAMTSAITEEEHIERLQQQEEARRKAEDSAARDREAAELTKMLENMDPETEKIVQAVVRRQERAMRRQYDDYYENMEEKVAAMEAQEAA